MCKAIRYGPVPKLPGTVPYAVRVTAVLFISNPVIG